MSVIIRLQGLSWSASAMDIRNFFQGLNIPPGGVRIIGGEKGDAFIAFSTDEDARQAMMLTTKNLNGSPVQLFLSSKTEMQNTILQAKDHGVVPGVASTAVSAPPVMSQVAPVIATASQQTNLGQQATLGMPLSSQAMHGMGASQQHPPMMTMQHFQNVFPGGNMPPNNLLSNVLSAISQSSTGAAQTSKSPNQPQLDQSFPGEYAMGGNSQNSHVGANACQGKYGYESPAHPFSMGQQSLINQSFPLAPNSFVNKPDTLMNQLPSMAPNQLQSQAQNQLQSQAQNQLQSQAQNQLPSQTPSLLQSQAPHPSIFHTNEPSHMWGGGLQFNPTALPRFPPSFGYGDAHKNVINIPGKFGPNNPPYGMMTQPNSNVQRPVFSPGNKQITSNNSFGVSNQPNMNEPPPPVFSSATKSSLLGNPVNQLSVNEQHPALVSLASKQGNQQFNKVNEGYGYANKLEAQKDTRPPTDTGSTAEFTSDKRDTFGRNIRLEDWNSAQPVENESKKQEISKENTESRGKDPIKPNDQRFGSRDRSRQRDSPRDNDHDRRDRSRRDRDKDDDRKSRRGADRDRNHDRRNRDRDSLRRDRNRDSERKNIDSPASDTSHRTSRKRSLSPNSKAANTEREKKLQTESSSQLKSSNTKPVDKRDLKVVPLNIPQSVPSASNLNTISSSTASSDMKKPAFGQQQPLISTLPPPLPVRGLLGEAPVGHPPLATGSNHMQNRAGPRDYNQPKVPGYLQAPPSSTFHNQGHMPNDQGPMKRPEDFQGPYLGSPGPQSLGGINSNIDGPPFEAHERGGPPRPRDGPIMDERPPREFSGLPRNNSHSSFTGPRRPSETRLPSLLGDGPMPPGPDKFRDVPPVFVDRDDWRGPPGGDNNISGSGGRGGQQKPEFRGGDQYHEEFDEVMHKHPLDMEFPDQQGFREQSGNPEEFLGMQDPRGHYDQATMRGASGNRGGAPGNRGGAPGNRGGAPGNRGMVNERFRGPHEQQEIRASRDFQGPVDQRGPQDFMGPPDQPNIHEPQGSHDVTGFREFRAPHNGIRDPGMLGPPDFRGPPDQHEFRGPPNQHEFRGPPNQHEFRGPPNKLEFRGPTDEHDHNGPMDFRRPPDQCKFRGPTNEHDHRRPPDFNKPNMRGPHVFRGPPDRRGPQEIRGPSDQQENRAFADFQDESDMEPYNSYNQNEMEQEYYNEEPEDNFGPHSQHDFRGQSNFSDRVTIGNQGLQEQQDTRCSDFSNRALMDNRGPPDYRPARYNRPGFHEDRKPNFDEMPRDSMEHNVPFDKHFDQPNRQRLAFDGRHMNLSHSLEFLDGNRKGFSNDRRPSFEPDHQNQERSRDRDRPLDNRDKVSERRAGDDRGRSDRNKGQNTSRQTSRNGSDKRSLTKKDESSDSNKNENIVDPKTTDKKYENLKESPAPGDTVSLATSTKQSDSKDTNSALVSEKGNDKNLESNALCTVVIENILLETSYKDLRKLFTGCNIPKEGIKMINDNEGKRTGKAYIKFATQESYKKAFQWDRSLLGNKRIVIKPISKKEYDDAVDSYYPSTDEDDGDHSYDNRNICNTLSATLRTLKGQSELKLPLKRSSVPKDFVIQVLNLPETATIESIRKFFSTCSIALKGDAVYIESDQNKTCTGLCYVEFADNQSYQKALSQTLQFENKPVNISKATKKDIDELLKKMKKEVGSETKVPISQKPNPGAVTNNVEQNDVQSSMDSKSITSESSKKDPVETCIRICNIPHFYKNIDVRQIFDNIDVTIKNCQVCHDSMGKPIGEAYIELNNSAEAQLCMVKNGAMVGRSCISLIPILKSKMIDSLRTHRHAPQPELPRSSAVFFFVKASNLPVGVTTGEIINFFSGYNPAPESIRLNISEKNEIQGSSTALIGFRTREAAETAIERTNNNSLRNRRVTLTKVML